MNQSTAYRRIRNRNDFVYLDADEHEVTDAPLIKYFESLVIPPAWNDVLIARSKAAKTLARGIDAAGRTQAIYHPKYRARQEKLKFDRILRFGLALPHLRRQLQKDLARRRYSRDKVVATVVTLIDQAHFRVGNTKYAKENQSFGATTLRSKHTDVTGSTVTFNFTGKSGKEQIKKLDDGQLARIIKRLDEMPGYNIFRYEDSSGKLQDVSSSDVNDYIKRVMGEEFSAKDFRTWSGTVVACAGLAEANTAGTEKQREKLITETVKQVAERLGNTPAVARTSYIDPRVLSTYLSRPSDLTKIKTTIDKMRPKKYLSRDEQYLLKLLNNN